MNKKNEQITKNIEYTESEAQINTTANTGYVENPGTYRQMVWLKDWLKSPEFKNSPYKSPVILGVDTVGKPVCYDFDNMPGLLIAGRAGCGKTQLMYSIALSLMKKQKHNECKFVIFDTKSGDFYYFDWCSCMLNSVQTSAERTNGLGCVESEALTRHQLVINNKKDELKECTRLVVIIDEVNDLLAVHGKKFAKWVTRVLSNAQGTKIHIIMATSVLGPDTLLDSFKEVFPCKVYFCMDYSTQKLLNNKDILHLQEYGDMLFLDGSNRPTRIHVPFISKDDLKSYFVKKGKKNATKKLLEMLHYEFPLHVVQDLIKRGADVNAKTKWGEPLLHWIDNPQIIQALIDEFADLMIVACKEVERIVQYITQQARAAGVHLIIGTQHASKKVLTDLIKENMPTRIAFRTRTPVESMQILDEHGAENLMPCADMLFSNAGQVPVRIHTPYIEY